MEWQITRNNKDEWHWERKDIPEKIEEKANLGENEIFRKKNYIFLNINAVLTKFYASM